MQHVAGLDELAEFFGAPPKVEHPDLPYEANVITAEVDLGHHNVWLQFMPRQDWAELRVAGQPFSIVKLTLSDISHLSLRKTEEDHTLVIKFDRRQTSTLFLMLRPHVTLFWGNQGDEDDDPTLLSVV